MKDKWKKILDQESENFQKEINAKDEKKIKIQIYRKQRIDHLKKILPEIKNKVQTLKDLLSSHNIDVVESYIAEDGSIQWEVNFNYSPSEKKTINIKFWVYAKKDLYEFPDNFVVSDEDELIYEFYPTISGSIIPLEEDYDDPENMPINEFDTFEKMIDKFLEVFKKNIVSLKYKFKS